jgi:hypothetical protein
LIRRLPMRVVPVWSNATPARTVPYVGVFKQMEGNAGTNQCSAE